jgi:hypothetical protein
MLSTAERITRITANAVRDLPTIAAFQLSLIA